MSEQKERGDVEQALNELVQSTEAGITEGVKAAHKRLDAMGVSVKRRAAALRKLSAETSEGDPKTAAPVQRHAPGPTAKVAEDRNEKIRQDTNAPATGDDGKK